MIEVGDIKWAAGFLEGEGCFRMSKGSDYRPTPTLTAVQVNNEPLERLVNIFHLGTISLHSRSKYNGQDIHVWRLYGNKAIQVMMTLYPLMSEHRKESIKDVVLRWRTVPLPNKNKTHCPQGHEYTKENTHHSKTGRVCRECDRISHRITRQLIRKNIQEENK